MLDVLYLGGKQKRMETDFTNRTEGEVDMSESLVNYIEIGSPSDYHKLNSPNLVEINSIDFLNNIRSKKNVFEEVSNYQYILKNISETSNQYLETFLREENIITGNLEIHSIIRFRANQETNLKFVRCRQAISNFENDATLSRVKFDTTEYREVKGEHWLCVDEVNKISGFFTKCFSSNFPYLTSPYDDDKVFPEVYFVLFKYILNNEVFYFELKLKETKNFLGRMEYRRYLSSVDFFEFFLKFKSNINIDKSIEGCIAEAGEYTKKLIFKNKIRNMIWQFQLTVGFILRSILFGGIVFPIVIMFALCLVDGCVDIGNY